MKKTCKKSVAVLAAASVCSSMLLNFPSGTFPIHWSASAEEPASNVEGIAINEENFPDANFRESFRLGGSASRQNRDDGPK